MILIFDFFETIIHNKSMDFNRGLKIMWEKYYKDKCSFEEISAYGEEQFLHISEVHKQGLEYAFVKDELPEYAEKFGGDTVKMSAEEEADFLMKCNEMENMSYIPEALAQLQKMGIPMYVLSNSGFTAAALSIVLEKLGIRKYFNKIWSSADYGKIKPSRELFEMAIEQVLLDNPAEKRENIVFVGDTYESDVKGANNAGIDVIWLNHKGEKNAVHLSVYSISNAGELVGAVKDVMKCRMEKGRIIFLNGVTSAGKTSIVEALQERDDVFFYVIANDLFQEMVGDKYLRENYWKYLSEVIIMMYHTAKLYSDMGKNVLIDGILVEREEIKPHYHQLLEILKDNPLDVVEVYCPLDICRQRNITRGNRYETQSQEQHDLMTENIKYSLKVDTSKYSSEECAEKIIKGLFN